MSALRKEIERISRVSHVKENDVLLSLIQDCCNIISTNEFNVNTFENTLYRFGKDFRKNPNENIKKEDSSKLLECYMNEIIKNEPFTDLLTVEFGGGENVSLGQYFTPPDVASLNAMIITALQPKEQSTFDVADLSGCGSGGLILGRLREIFKIHGKEGIKKTEVTAVDIDESAVKTAIVQIIFNCQLKRLPLKSFECFRENALKEHNENNLMALWKPEVNEISEILEK